MFKYLLEENLIGLNDSVVELGYDHCIESWEQMPKEDDVLFWIKDRINRHWKGKSIKKISFTLYKVDTSNEEKEWDVVW